MTLEARSNSVGIGAFFEGLAHGLSDVLGKRVLLAAQHVTGEVRKTTQAVFPSGKTGQLPRSFRPTFLGWDGSVVSAASHSDLVYAEILDKGGTIRAKNVSKLAVPLSSARVPLGKWPRHWGSKELIAIKRRGKNTILATVSKKGLIKPQYVLLPQVSIRGRNYLERAADASASGIEEILGSGIDELVNRTEAD